jgi:general stress protein YciG
MARESNRGSRKQSKGSRQNISNRGFASMDPEQQREIASLGGRASHEQGIGHEWDSREAREAGRKGGLARGRNS